MESGTCSGWFDGDGLPYHGVDTSGRAGGATLWWAPGYKIFRDGIVTRNDLVLRWCMATGRPTVSVLDVRSGIFESKTVVRLVGECFADTFKPELRASFVDGCRHHVWPENVVWVPARQTIVKHRPPGWRTAKLTADDVLHIRRCEESDAEAAKRFGISEIYVFQLRQGRYWKHLPNENTSTEV